MKLNGLLGISALAFIQLLLGSASASAEIEQVPFSGVITANCAFDTASLVTGDIASTVDGQGLISSSPVSLPLACNTNTLVKVTAVTQTAGFDLSTLLNYSAIGTATSASGTANNIPGDTYTINVGANGSLNEMLAVGLSVTADAIIPADTYSFEVVVSATPL